MSSLFSSRRFSDQSFILQHAKGIASLFLLFGLLSTIVGAAWAAPPPLPNHFAVAIGNSTDILWLVREKGFSGYRRWNPTSGTEKDYVLPWTPDFDSVVDTRHGLLFDSRTSPRSKNTIGVGSIWLATHDGKTLTARLGVGRVRPRMLTLADQSVLLLGGIVELDRNGKPHKFSNAVERVVYASGQLTVERLPDLPGPTRTGYGLVALPDGRAMVLGGSTSQWIGCQPCIADTYFFDVKKKIWNAGPPMSEARANPSVTLMSDGNLLIAGGWTPGHGDGGWGVTSRTTERWESKSNRFVTGSSLPTGVAMHHAVWAAGHEGKILVLAGGNSAAVQTYDVASNTSQVAAELCEPHRTDKIFPFLFQGETYLWLFDGEAGWCKEGAYEEEKNFMVAPRRLVRLRLGSQPFDIQSGIALNRNDFRFVPGDGTSPSYAIGGRVAGNNQHDIPDAYAIWPEGRIEHIAPTKVPYPPRIDRSALPPLNRDRTPDKGNSWKVAEKLLSDGRVIVAGGDVQVHKIAVVTEHSMSPNSADTYLGVGEYLPSRRHEVYEPAAGTWRNSAPSVAAGGPVAIFDDGRVVKLGRLAARTTANKDGGDAVETEQYLLEISSPDGESWTQVKALSAVRLTHAARPFVVQNELFLSGQLPDGGSGGGPEIVQWFDAAQSRWETLWQITPGDNWRFHIGRIIVRTLPNGKRVVVPTGGF